MNTPLSTCMRGCGDCHRRLHCDTERGKPAFESLACFRKCRQQFRENGSRLAARDFSIQLTAA
jgi:hypothetical protein